MPATIAQQPLAPSAALLAPSAALLAPSAALLVPSAATPLLTPSALSTLNTSSSSASCSHSTLRLDSSHCLLVSHSFLYHAECNHTDGEPWAPRRMLITGTGRSGTEFVAQILRLAGLDVVHDSRKLMEAPSSKGGMGVTGAHGAVSWPQAFRSPEDMQQWCVPSWTWSDEQLSLESTRPRAGVVGHERLLTHKHEHDRRLFQHLIHLVRSPLEAINSRWNMGDINIFEAPTACFTSAYIPKCVSDGTLDQCSADETLRATLHHWVLWNTFVEATAQWRVRVEDLNSSAAFFLLTERVDLTGSLNSTAQQLDDALARVGTGKNSGHTKKGARLPPVAPRPFSTVPVPPRAFLPWLTPPGLTRAGTTPLTWSRLSAIDADFTAQAQLMARRYGYHVAEEDESPAFGAMQCPIQACELHESYRWKCALVEHGHGGR